MPCKPESYGKQNNGRNGKRPSQSPERAARPASTPRGLLRAWRSCGIDALVQASDHETLESYEVIEKLADQLPIINENDADKLKGVLRLLKSCDENDGSVRCIAALTHDLGYPLKKI